MRPDHRAVVRNGVCLLTWLSAGAALVLGCTPGTDDFDYGAPSGTAPANDGKPQAIGLSIPDTYVDTSHDAGGTADTPAGADNGQETGGGGTDTSACTPVRDGFGDCVCQENPSQTTTGCQ